MLCKSLVPHLKLDLISCLCLDSSSKLQSLLQPTARRYISHSTTPRPNPLTSPNHAFVDSKRTESTVSVGTSYEHLCAATLHRLGFDLTRTGGRSDKGIDLLGTWTVPSSHDPARADRTCRVVAQCKARKAAPTPMWVRELDGAVAGAPARWKGDDVIRLLCAKGEATGGVREAVRTSEKPVVWVRVEEVGRERMADGEPVLKRGRVRQVFWNNLVQRMVGQDMGVGVKYSRSTVGGVEHEVCLTMAGRIWQPPIEIPLKTP